MWSSRKKLNIQFFKCWHTCASYINYWSHLIFPYYQVISGHYTITELAILVNFSMSRWPLSWVLTSQLSSFSVIPWASVIQSNQLYNEPFSNHLVTERCWLTQPCITFTHGRLSESFLLLGRRMCIWTWRHLRDRVPPPTHAPARLGCRLPSFLESWVTAYS